VVAKTTFVSLLTIILKLQTQFKKELCKRTYYQLRGQTPPADPHTWAVTGKDPQTESDCGELCAQSVKRATI